MGIGYDVELIPLEEIYSDEKFNCRQDVINRIDVLSLMESIHAGRLENPIVVQPLAEIVVVTPPPDGAKFRALNGNRRFAAFRFLAKDFPGEVRYKAIPAIVRCGLDDDTARALNISDNLEHKDLNLLQESKSLEKWFRAGYTRDTVARMLKQSSSWV
jgi:ParB-like chromosome segregation protein Spo0J